MVSLGGKIDGNQIVLWSLEEGKSECIQAASTSSQEICQDVKFYNNTPNKFITAHNNAVKFWTFNEKQSKFLVTDCQLGHIKRFINCVSIDKTDTFAYCGTRTGDILEIFVDKAIFKRVGPINRIFTGGIQAVISSFNKDIYIGAGDGSIAKINKKTMQIEE